MRTRGIWILTSVRGFGSAYMFSVPHASRHRSLPLCALLRQPSAQRAVHCRSRAPVAVQPARRTGPLAAAVLLHRCAQWRRQQRRSATLVWLAGGAAAEYLQRGGGTDGGAPASLLAARARAGCFARLHRHHVLRCSGAQVDRRGLDLEGCLEVHERHRSYSLRASSGCLDVCTH